ncbi:MAG: hypothetical protein DLM68_05320 [Hyphomicrobiales bacterium]|nr:MAG: hypothetical protein DLM68_05320 [Hyphomicrobiales bacterium]
MICRNSLKIFGRNLLKIVQSGETGGGFMIGDTEGKTQTNEIDFLFSLTRTFSESFAIKRDRVRNWRLMGILMELENGGSVAVSQLRKAIAPLVLKRRSI